MTAPSLRSIGTKRVRACTAWTVVMLCAGCSEESRPPSQEGLTSGVQVAKEAVAVAPRSPGGRLELALQTLRSALEGLGTFTLPEHVIRPRWSPDGRMAFGEHGDSATKRFGVTFFDEAGNSRFMDGADPPSEPYAIRLPSGNELQRRTTVRAGDLHWRHDSSGAVYGLTRSVVTIDARTGASTLHPLRNDAPNVPKPLITSPDGRIAAGVVWPEEDRHDEVLMRLHYGPHWRPETGLFGEQKRLSKLANEARAEGKYLARPEDVIAVPVHVRLIDPDSGTVRDVPIYNGIVMELKGLRFSFCGRWLAVLLTPMLYHAPRPPGIGAESAELILVDVAAGVVASRRAGVQGARPTADSLAWRRETSELAVITTSGTLCLRVDDSGRLGELGRSWSRPKRFAWVPGHRVLLAIAVEDTTPFLEIMRQVIVRLGHVDHSYRSWAMLIDAESGRTLRIPELVKDFPLETWVNPHDGSTHLRSTYTDYLALPQVNRLIDMWNP